LNSILDLAYKYKRAEISAATVSCESLKYKKNDITNHT